MFDNVIVGIGDYEPGRDALRLATELVSSDGRLTLVYVQVEGQKPAPDSGRLWELNDRNRAAELIGRVRAASHVDAPARLIQHHSVAKGLREFVVTREVDLLVIGASRRDDYERELIGDDTRDVLRDPPCPVAVAPVGYATRPSALKTIGIAYDGSAHSEQALSVAREVAREYGAQLSALEAVREPLYIHDVWHEQAEIDEGVEKARARIAALGDVAAHAASGDAAEELVRYGGSVDLLVMGAHKYSPLDTVMSGSTAQRVADSVPCPLLVLASIERAPARTASGRRDR